MIIYLRKLGSFIITDKVRVEGNTYIKVSVLRDSNLKLEDLNVSHRLTHWVERGKGYNT